MPLLSVSFFSINSHHLSFQSASLDDVTIRYEDAHKGDHGAMALSLERLEDALAERVIVQHGGNDAGGGVVQRTHS